MTLQAATPRLVLASASAARAALLRAAGLGFDIEAAAVDEAAVKQSARSDGGGAAETALRLAEMKAQRVSRRHPEALVIGCDQLLVSTGARGGADWFDKPADRGDAEAQLLRLRGREHRLVTAVLCLQAGVRLWHHLAEPRLWMRDFSDAFLRGYLDREGAAVTTTVGAYRLEGLGVQLFDRVEGEHAAVLGLPLLALLGYLRQRGILLR